MPQMGLGITRCGVFFPLLGAIVFFCVWVWKKKKEKEEEEKDDDDNDDDECVIPLYMIVKEYKGL